MKQRRIAATLVVVLAASATHVALADRGGHHGSWGGYERHEWHRHGGAFIYFGPTFFWPGYAPPAPAIVDPPPIYIERDAPPSATTGGRYWYYCDSAAAYYPYVKECPGGWRTVVPQQR